jgi:hypothetical protein
MYLLLEKFTVGQNLKTELYMRPFCVTITDNIITVLNDDGKVRRDLDKSHPDIKFILKIKTLENMQLSLETRVCHILLYVLCVLQNNTVFPSS